jgi:hypothetical protein
MDQTPGRFPPTSDAGPGWGAPQPPPSQASGGWVGYPLTIGRVIELTFSLLRFRPMPFIGVSLILMAPLFILIALAQLLVGDDLAAAQQAQLDFTRGIPVDLSRLLPIRALVVSYISIALVGLTGYLALGAISHLTAEAFTGRVPSARAALNATVSRFGSLLGAGLLTMLATYGLIIIGITIAAFLMLTSVVNGQLQPGIAVFVGLIVIVGMVVLLLVFVTRLYFVPQAVMLEGLRARAALGRSWRVVSGSTLRVLGFSLFFGLLIGVVSLLLEIVISLIVGSGFRVSGGTIVFEPVPFVLTAIAQTLVSTVMLPVTVIGMTILYFDLRFRRGEVPLPGAHVAPASGQSSSVPEQEGQPGIER